jgi:hypothetical protein
MKKLGILFLILLPSCHSVFVWTVGDVIGLAVLGLCALAIAALYVSYKVQQLWNKIFKSKA